MTAKTGIVAILSGLALLGASPAAQAGTAMEQALAKGAEQLTADEIAEQFVGKTGIWVSPPGDKKIEIYYGEDNDLHGEMIDGDWTGSGYYAVANTDDICISWDGQDEGRLRCLGASSWTGL